ncbi:MAG: 50S ribosomal protein L4 [Firmicutes bacterium]|nr:50S ribosomal protein L4 [Bacillota bacterium]HPU01515.1 50S ribosomal protein L4 [Bacillota bacterium]
MPKLTLYNRDGEQLSELEVQAGLFDAPLKKGALYYTAIAQRARRRQGTAATKNRSLVRGGGAKPWPQKGTGRARHGSIRSPIWVGGAVVFGPHPRSYAYRVPKKVRRAALASALSDRVREGKLIVVDDFQIEQPKTKAVVRLLENLQVSGSALLVTAQPDVNVIKSARNLPGVKTLTAAQLNVLDILNHEYLILSREALEKVQEVFGS